MTTIFTVNRHHESVFVAAVKVVESLPSDAHAQIIHIDSTKSVIVVNITKNGNWCIVLSISPLGTSSSKRLYWFQLPVFTHESGKKYKSDNGTSVLEMSIVSSESSEDNQFPTVLKETIRNGIVLIFSHLGQDDYIRHGVEPVSPKFSSHPVVPFVSL